MQVSDGRFQAESGWLCNKKSVGYYSGRSSYSAENCETR